MRTLRSTVDLGPARPDRPCELGEPDPRWKVRLVLLDEVGAAEAGPIARFFPNASCVATGLYPRPAESEIALDAP